MKRVALYFGSFNPLHYGHLGIAEYIILNCAIDRFDMVLSPHNPFKDKQILAQPQQRLIALKKAIFPFNKELKQKIESKNLQLAKQHKEIKPDTKVPNAPKVPNAANKKRWQGEILNLSKIKCNKVIVNDIEFHLSEPLYTFNTLKELQKRESDCEFIIVVGADSIAAMPRWYRGEELLKEYKVIVYPRKGYRVKTICRKYHALYLQDAPLNNISSTALRNL